MAHICVSKLTIIGLDNGLAPGRRQAIIQTNAGILLIRTLETNFSEILSDIHTFSFKKMNLKMTSTKWRQVYVGLNEITTILLPILNEMCGNTVHYMKYRRSDVVFAYITRSLSHDDVIKWKQFPRCWPFVWRIHRSAVKSPLKGQWRGALMFTLIYAWMDDLVNNREAGDLRRYRAHYDVTVMWNVWK